MGNLIHSYLATRILNTPLMIDNGKLEVILSAVGDMIGLEITEEMAALRGKYVPPVRGNEPKAETVAVIPVYDSLVNRAAGINALSGLTTYPRLRTQFREALADPKITRIVLEFDSPGGEVSGAFDLADEIYKARGKKPIFAHVNESAFSAAYLLASAADKIIVPRTGNVGSIGVIAVHVDRSGMDAQQGLKYTSIFAGSRKNDLSPHEPISQDGYAVVKSIVDSTYDLFVQTVARNRGLDEEAVRNTEAGVFRGEKAIQAGLADMIGTLETAIEGTIENKINLIGMEVHMDKATLKQEFPDVYAEIIAEGAATVDLEGGKTAAASVESEKIFGLLTAHFGPEAADKFKDLYATGISVEQYQAIQKMQPAVAAEATAEDKFKEKMLAAIEGAGAESVGSGGEPAGHQTKDFMGLVAAYVESHKCLRGEAIRAVSEANPGLRESWIKEVNKQK